MTKMVTSDEGKDLIKNFEGCKLSAYKPVPTEKYYTIGYGHYGPDVSKNMKINEATAEYLLIKDIQPIENLLNGLKINFRQRQFDALVSWIYNLGTGNFNSSTLKKYIVADHDDLSITDQMIKWVNAGGKPLPGLMRRRAAEANLWLGDEVYTIKNNKITRR